MPPEVKGRRYYIPSDQGQELKLRERRNCCGISTPKDTRDALTGLFALL